MGDINRILQPDEGQQIAVSGCTIYVLEASGPFRLIMDGSNTYTMEEGRKYKSGVPFSGFRVENAFNAANSITLAVTDGDYSDRRIANEVEISNLPSNPVPVEVNPSIWDKRPALRSECAFDAMVLAVSDVSYYAFVNPSGSGVDAIDPVFRVGQDNGVPITPTVVIDIVPEIVIASAIMPGASTSDVINGTKSVCAFGLITAAERASALGGGGHNWIDTNALLNTVNRSMPHGGFRVRPGQMMIIYLWNQGQYDRYGSLGWTWIEQPAA